MVSVEAAPRFHFRAMELEISPISPPGQRRALRQVLPARLGWRLLGRRLRDLFQQRRDGIFGRRVDQPA
jgi:hypothetical protein